MVWGEIIYLDGDRRGCYRKVLREARGGSPVAPRKASFWSGNRLSAKPKKGPGAVCPVFLMKKFFVQMRQSV